MNTVVGLELGGTKCVAALARDGAIVARETVPTTVPDETLPTLAAIVEGWREDNDIAAIGIATFGPIVLDRASPRYGQILGTSKPGWSGAPIAGFFADTRGLPIALDTDVNGAALAERAWGAARGCDGVVYITIGTGIGVGIIVNGRPVHGLLHPEFGHLRVRRAPGDEFAGICPYHGDCIEGLASGSAIVARTGHRVDALPDGHPALAVLTADLAELIAALILAVSPERIVIGGGAGLALAEAGRLPAIGLAAQARLAGYVGPLGAPDLAGYLVPAALGADAGPRGAVLLAIAARDGVTAAVAGGQGHRSPQNVPRTVSP